MKRTTSLLAALILLSHAPTPAPSAHAQQQQQPAPAPQAPTPKASPTPPPADNDDDVVRITTNLVQVDVVVTDKDGRQVTDLTPEDFEILEDGKPREITNFSYVSNETTPATESPRKKTDAERAADKSAPPVPPARLRPGNVRRTIALVVDDLGTSFESIGAVRHALKKYVDEQMQPGDLVAIMRTSAGMGALQQFTNDKAMLYRAIEKVRWYPSGRSGVSAFAAIEPDPLAAARAQLDARSGRSDEDSERDRRQREQGEAEGIDEFREEIFSVGTLGALNFIVRGLRELPGRKSVILFSDGFEIANTDGRGGGRIIEALRRLTDLANRSSVVVYTIDARGLAYTGMTAADSTAGMTPDQIEQRLGERRDNYFSTQQGLSYLAQQTGGLFVRNSNDLAGGVRKALNDQKGFYLIGYRPDPETFDAARGRGRFNKIAVKVSRPGLKVRTRAGFYGFTENERPVRRTREEQLIAAITSPFGSGDVPLRQTALFSNEGEKANFISSLTHIDVGGFKFEEEPDGWRKTTLDIVAFTFGENGNVIDEVNRTETVRARGEAFDELLRSGLIYTMRIPVKKPGAYQLRIAVRDAGSQRVGSAGQYVEVPNLGKKRLALSGIVMTGNGLISANLSGTPAEQRNKDYDPMATSAVRRFRQNTWVEYMLYIYNAKTNPPAATRPQLQYQMRLFREGQPVFTGKLQDYDPGNQTDMTHLMVVGRLRLGTDLKPGDYVMQIVVTDALAKEKYRMATQWIDFEIVK